MEVNYISLKEIQIPILVEFFTFVGVILSLKIFFLCFNQF